MRTLQYCATHFSISFFSVQVFILPDREGSVRIKGWRADELGWLPNIGWYGKARGYPKFPLKSQCYTAYVYIGEDSDGGNGGDGGDIQCRGVLCKSRRTSTPPIHHKAVTSKHTHTTILSSLSFWVENDSWWEYRQCISKETCDVKRPNGAKEREVAEFRLNSECKFQWVVVAYFLSQCHKFNWLKFWKFWTFWFL